MTTGAAGSNVTLDANYQDGTGTGVVPGSPLVDIIDPTLTEVVSNAVPTQVGPVGHYEYVYAIPAGGPVGAWTARWAGTINSVAVQADEVFTVVAAGGIVFAGVGGGTCTPWATDADVCEPCSTYEFDTVLLDDSLQIASDVLFELTGRRWPGECAATIRPAGLRRHVSIPYPTGAPWRGLGAGSCCACGSPRLSEVDLGATRGTAVNEVLIDGVVVDPARYRVDDWRWLVYLPESDDAERQGWPCCQLLHLAATEVDTFQVSYEYGTAPPAGGVRAAAVLGCQLALACQPDTVGACRLPKRITSITRQGVSVAVLDPLTLFADGLTGLPEVDLWLESVRLGNARRAASVWTPGQRRGHRRTNT